MSASRTCKGRMETLTRLMRRCWRPPCSRPTTFAESCQTSSTPTAHTRLACGYVAAFEPKVMAVGRDMRLSSPEIAAAAIRGAADSGADVVDLGQIGTEMLYFAVGEYGYEGGLQITASHNPAAYNGMKIVRRGALPVGGDTRPRQDQGARPRRRARSRPSSPGERLEARRLRRVPRPGAAGSSTSMPCSRSTWCSTARTGWPARWSRRSLERLPVTVHPYNLEPDGHFPNHEPNPLLEENRQFIMGKVQASTAPISASPGTATPIAASSSTTPASSCPATSSPR